MNFYQAIKKAYEDNWNLVGTDKEKKETYRIIFNGNDFIICKDGRQWRIDVNKIDFQPYYKGKE